MNYGNGKKIAYYRPPSQSESALSFDDFEDDEKDNVKRKTRNLSEKKRRDQFNVLINELCSMVASSNKKIDKSSVLKSAIQFLRNHQEFSVQSAAKEIKEDWKPTFLCNEEFAQLMLEAVDSFLIVFSQQGKVLFTSESVTSLLGHLPVDLINNSLYDLMHEDDRLKFFDLLSKQTPDSSSISFTCHLRRGTIDPKESATYEYVHVFGTPQVISNGEDTADFMGINLPDQSSLCFCCTVKLLTSHIIREMSVVDESTCEFTSRHSLEWKFLFLDHRAPPIIGYLPFEVLGTSGYDYYHPDDLEAVSKCHEELMVKGKGTSSFYRFLTKGQQWIWLQTRFFITYHQWNSKPEFIVCTNTIVSYCDVRCQLRQEMGYQEGDSALASGHSSNPLSRVNSSKVARVVKDATPSEECHVTSFGQPESLGLTSSSKVQSPDVASSQHSDNERIELPHSTKQEGNSRRHVSSQLQSLLQMHLQRSLMSSSQSLTQAANSNSDTMKITSMLGGIGETGQQRRKSNTAEAKSVVSNPNQVPLPAQSSLSSEGSSLVPVVASFPAGRVVGTTSSVVPQGGELVTSTPQVVSQPPSFQSGLVLTATQQILREQLIEKSKKLQDDIQKQQEELRMINEQLSYAHNRSLTQQSQQQLPQLQQSPKHFQQHAQKQPHHQQYIIQPRLGLPTESMVLAPGNSGHQLTMMGSNSGQIFLSPITNVSMDISQTPNPQQQQQHVLHQLQSQQHQPQLIHGHQHYQPSQIVLHQDTTGLGTQSMVLSPSSPAHQLAMMTSSSNQIFLSPIANVNMDLQTSPHQQQQQQQSPQEQTHSLHYPNITITSSDLNSPDVDLPDSC